MFVNEMRVLEREQANDTNPFLVESTGSQEKTISGYILDDKEWVLTPVINGNYEILTRGSREITWWTENGEYIAGATELTVGITGVVFFGCMFLGGPITWASIPLYVSTLGIFLVHLSQLMDGID